MSGTVLSPIGQALKVADAAWTALNTGQSVRAVTDQNGERIEFSTANRAGLLAYIVSLQARCTDYQSIALGNFPRPLGFVY